MEDNNYWNSSSSVADGEKYNIDGLNIWEHKWEDTGEYFFKYEPVRQKNHKISVYEIAIEGKRIKFGAVGVSNGVWMIYTNYK